MNEKRRANEVVLKIKRTKALNCAQLKMIPIFVGKSVVEKLAQ